MTEDFTFHCPDCNRMLKPTTKGLICRYCDSEFNNFGEEDFLISERSYKHKQNHNKTIFKINEYLTLKLEGGTSNIYVRGRLFNQCKYLLLNIPVAHVKKFDNIESIDEAAEKLNRSMEGSGRSRVNVSPRAEFWGHCSNLQEWAENRYDTRLLHRNLEKLCIMLYTLYFQ